MLNAANEAAVELFLRGKLSFNGIYESVHSALDNIKQTGPASLDDIMAADNEARWLVYERKKT